MPRLSSAARAVFAAVRADCYCGLDSVALREVVSARLARFLRADAYCAMELDPVSYLPVHDVNFGWPACYVEPLVEHALFASKAADTGLLPKRPRRAVRADELIEGGNPKKDPYYLHHVFAFGYAHEAQLYCAAGEVPRALFTFNRKGGRGEFAPGELRLLDSLAPHIAAGMHAAVIRAGLSLLPATESGFIALGPDGAIELAAGVGERLLSGAWDAGPGAPLGVRVIVAMLRRALRDPGATVPDGVRDVDPRDRRAYRITPERCAAPDGRPRFAMLIEPDRPGESVHGLTDLGLTAREAEVALALVRGDRVVDCARALGCSPATVAQHTKHVFAKLGVSSRRELAARLLVRGMRAKVDPTDHGIP